jgi:hypothetical protein
MKTTILAAALCLALTGCASIIKGGTQPVTIKSVPEGAAVSVTNRAGEKIHAGTTPATLTLKRGAGYFQSEVYSVAIQKDGYAPQTLTITGSVNGWYIGNILFGGLIGMLAVDPVTGAMYSFPDDVSATLQQQPARTSEATGTLTIVSTESLSPATMQHARRVTAN